jgi:hypothetical protein
VLTPRHETKAQSLMAMREQMVRDGGTVAALAIGGRTDEGGGHRPGIEEDVCLARRADLPVYLLDASGALAGGVAAREAVAVPPWAGLGNKLDPERNTLLHDTKAYETAARLIWNCPSWGRLAVSRTDDETTVPASVGMRASPPAVT